MTVILAILAAIGVFIFTAILALKSGLARRVFYKMHACVKGEDLLASTILRTPPVNSPYQRWLERAKNEIPMFEGLLIQDIELVALSPWPQMGEGVTGLYLRLADYQMIDGCILEIPSRGKTSSQRHLYEKGIYFLSGEGYTTLQQEGKPLQRINWAAGDLFSVPLNVLHQHFNTGNYPARMLVVTSFPLVLNLMNNEDFIDKNAYAFTDRYDGATDYLERSGELHKLEITANFVQDIRQTATRKNDFRGGGNESIRWLMAGNSMLSMHISKLPPRMLKKAHRLTSNGFVLILSGEGVSALWREGAWNHRLRVDWQPGTLFAPPVFWYQQHLNTGLSSARYLVINIPGFVKNIGLHFEDQIEVDSPEISKEWKAELDQTAKKKR